MASLPLGPHPPENEAAKIAPMADDKVLSGLIPASSDLCRVGFRPSLLSPCRICRFPLISDSLLCFALRRLIPLLCNFFSVIPHRSQLGMGDSVDEGKISPDSSVFCWSLLSIMFIFHPFNLFGDQLIFLFFILVCCRRIPVLVLICSFSSDLRCYGLSIL